jgi:hypothetical protein
MTSRNEKPELENKPGLGQKPEPSPAGEERLCLFLGTERLGVVFVYDITNPYAPVFQSVVRAPQTNATDSLTRLSAPEGVAYAR